MKGALLFAGAPVFLSGVKKALVRVHSTGLFVRKGEALIFSPPGKKKIINAMVNRILKRERQKREI
jgi:hypothetical protein